MMFGDLRPSFWCGVVRFGMVRMDVLIIGVGLLGP